MCAPLSRISLEKRALMLRGEAAKRYARGGGRHVCALLCSWLRLPVYLVFLFRASHYVLTSVRMFVCQVVGEGVRRGGGSGNSKVKRRQMRRHPCC